MYTRVIAVLAALAVLIVVIGCGEKENYKERFLKLQEQHEKEMGRLEEQRKGYEQKLSSYDTELSALRERLAAAQTLIDEIKVNLGASTGVLEAGEKESLKEEKAQGGEETEAPVNIVSSAKPTNEEIDYLLEWFAWSHEPFIDEGMREEYRKDFSDYIANLREQSTDEPMPERKDKVLSSLQQQINQTTDDSERELLQRRIEKLQNADEDDLEGILDYYQRLDNIQGLNHLMEKYNISREELRESGIAPPPRGSWGPDVKEIAYNLNNFVRNYEPLAETGQRDQYRKDFNDYITNLTTRPTDEQVLQRRDQMLRDLEERRKTASEGEKQRLERRMRRLQDSDTDRLRRWVQIDKLSELNKLAEKYGIPNNELRQSGVLLLRRRGPRR